MTEKNNYENIKCPKDGWSFDSRASRRDFEKIPGEYICSQFSIFLRTIISNKNKFVINLG